MTEDEKEAIEILKDSIGILEGKSSIRYTNYDIIIACNTFLSLIEKQQKEIEELQIKLKIEKIDNKYNQEERDEETIPKYKIREKIQELEKQCEKELLTTWLESQIDILQELLEE